MTARQLQDAIVADLTELFKNRRYKTPAGGTAPLTVAAQNLPLRDSEESPDPFPYIIVRLTEGGIATQSDPHKVSVFLLIGIFDDDKANQGHRTVLEILEVIQEHYEEKNVLDNQFVFIDPFEWALQEEESFPFYFGGANLTFTLSAPRHNWSSLV